MVQYIPFFQTSNASLTIPPEGPMAAPLPSMTITPVPSGPWAPLQEVKAIAIKNVDRRMFPPAHSLRELRSPVHGHFICRFHLRGAAACIIMHRHADGADRDYR